MADDLLSLLSATDLQGFNNYVQQSDPFGIAGRSLAQWTPNYSYMDATESGLTSFGKAFAQGLLQNYAQNNANQQLSSVINVLPQLTSDPLSVAAPAGVDSGAFGLLRGSAYLRDLQNDAISEEKKENRVGALLQSVLPSLVNSRQIKMEDALNIATSEDPTASLTQMVGATKAVPVDPAVPAIDNPLANGRESTNQKIKAYYQDFLANGMPPTQAASAAKEQVKGEIMANNKTFDDVKAARAYGENLMQLANTARAGMSQAGETGKFNSLAKGYEYIANLFGSDEAATQIAGDTLLDSVGPDVIKLARPIGGGATSDFEARAYLGSGPSTRNTPEGNAILTQKLENLGKLNLDYADFMEAYREANAGSTIGADSKWSQYKQKFPLFIGEGDKMTINTERPSWQEYFSGVGAGAIPEGVSQNTTQQAAQLTQDVYNQLRAQGLSKEQIKAKYGL